MVAESWPEPATPPAKTRPGPPPPPTYSRTNERGISPPFARSLVRSVLERRAEVLGDLTRLRGRECPAGVLRVRVGECDAHVCAHALRSLRRFHPRETIRHVRGILRVCENVRECGRADRVHTGERRLLGHDNPFRSHRTFIRSMYVLYRTNVRILFGVCKEIVKIVCERTFVRLALSYVECQLVAYATTPLAPYGGLCVVSHVASVARKNLPILECHSNYVTREGVV